MGELERNDGLSDSLPSSDVGGGCVHPRSGAETVQTIIARAYGVVLIVLAVGFVLFVLMTSCMAFMHPDRAKQFLDLYAGPALTLLTIYGAKAVHEYSRTQIDQNKPKT